MKLGALFSGGKDSNYAIYIAKKNGYEISCLILIISENRESYMFHTPSIEKTKIQAGCMDIPIVIKKTKGEKEKELNDLTQAIRIAKEKYKIEGVLTGAIKSVYQASRIQKICDELNLECFNPLWQKDQIKLLDELIKNKFKVIITSVSAFPLNKSWLGREINKNFIKEIKLMYKKYGINPAGEGGEFETFVLDCPLFKKELKIKNKKIFSEGENNFRMEIDII